jgi:surface antigen
MLCSLAFRVRRVGFASLLLAAAGAITAASAPAPAFAQYGGGAPYGGSTYGADNRACDRGALAGVFSTSTNNLLGSAVGAAAGGLLGSQFGKGSGNTVMTIAGVLAGALAGGYIGRSMDPVDQGCVSRALEHAPTRQTVAWKNPDTNASYWVTPTRTYQNDEGLPCREYVTTALIDGKRERLTGRACRQPDGTWKVANRE